MEEITVRMQKSHQVYIPADERPAWLDTNTVVLVDKEPENSQQRIYVERYGGLNAYVRDNWTLGTSVVEDFEPGETTTIRIGEI